MTSFLAKIGWKRLRERKKNISFRFVSFRPDAQEKIQNKIAKKLNKLKDTVMASFQAKSGWKRLRKRKNKNCLSIPFLPDR